MIEGLIFSPQNKEALEAKRLNKPHEGIACYYGDIAIYRLGGGHPENISELARQRKNRNYLLPSLPPKMKTIRKFHVLVKSDQLWTQFLYFDGVPEFGSVNTLIGELAKAMRPKEKEDMRRKQFREALVQLLGGQLAVFSEFVETQTPPGWTRSPSCELDINEKLWLDSRRVALPKREDTEEHLQEDLEFEEAYHSGEWADQVAGRFASFVNTQLRKVGVEAVGDKEYFSLARQAVIEVAWPQPMQRRAPKENQL